MNDSRTPQEEIENEIYKTSWTNIDRLKSHLRILKMEASSTRCSFESISILALALVIARTVNGAIFILIIRHADKRARAFSLLFWRGWSLSSTFLSQALPAFQIMVRQWMLPVGCWGWEKKVRRNWMKLSWFFFLLKLKHKWNERDDDDCCWLLIGEG